MRYVAFLSIIFTAGCLVEPVTTTKSNNAGFEIKELFMHDSITIYRFRDRGNYHYFTKNETISTHSCGRNCRYQENIANKP